MLKTVSGITLVTAAAIALPSIALAQKPIKVDLVAYFDKITPPPRTAAEAYTKADCGTPETPHDCNADGLFDKFTAEMIGLNMQINSPDAASTIAGGGDLAKQMQDPAFVEKMKNMSDADKMKLAMQVQNDVMKQAKPSSSYEKPAVIEVIKELGNLGDSDAKAAATEMNAVAADNQRLIAFNALQDSVDNGEEEEVARLPKPFMTEAGEGGNEHVPDPAVEKAVRMKHWEKHITLTNERLALLGEKWSKRKSDYIARYKKFNTDLASIHYGDDANGEGTRKMLASGQSKIIGALQNLAALSDQLWDLGVQWQQRKLEREKRVDDMVAGRHH